MLNSVTEGRCVSLVLGLNKGGLTYSALLLSHFTRFGHGILCFEFREEKQ